MTSGPAHPRVEPVLALLAATAVVGTVAVVALLPVAVATCGLVLFAVGILRSSRTWLSAGSLVLFGSVAAAAIVASDPVIVLVGGAAAVLAWDLAERGVTLGEHIGRRAVSRRLRVVHATGSLVVALAGVGAGYVVLAIDTGSLPLPSLVAFLVGLVTVVALLGD